MRRVVPATTLTLAVLAAVLVPLAQPTAGAPNAPPRVVLGSPDQQRNLVDAALTGDGRQVAFRSVFGDTASTAFVRDLEQTTTTPVPADAEGTTGPVSISGDGRLLAYTVSPSESATGKGVLYSVDRQAPAGSQVHQVTGTPNDLPYQRTGGCSLSGSSCAALSSDGTTLAFPVRQSIGSPSMRLSLDAGSLGDPGNGTFEPLVDFGRISGGESKVLDLHVDAVDPLVFPETGPTVEGDPVFRIDTSTAPCAGTIAAGQRCTVRLRFETSPDCEYQSQATLRLPGTTPAGQSAVALLGDCFSGGPGDAVAPRAVEGPCTGETTYEGPDQFPSEPHEGLSGAFTFSLGERDTHEVSMFAARVSNMSEGPSTVGVYAEAGCPFKLVVPKSQPADACRPGAELEVGSTCVAYIEFKPDRVAPYAGEISFGGTDYRLIAHSGLTVVAAWRDPSGGGNFAAAGPARVVSAKGPDGTPMEGYAPALSANGRWVAYTSFDDLGRPAGDDSGTQVYVHDSDAAGDGTGKHGQTLLASLLPSGGLVPSAGDASLSGDGTRVAFSSSADPAPLEVTQAFVRDLPTQRTIVASTSPTGALGDPNSAFPVLSTDGNTVAYQSIASNLVEGLPPPSTWQVYARDIQTDFAGGRGTNELMSIDQTGQSSSEWAGFPAINADGSVVAFQTDAALTYNDVGDVENAETDVYVATRQANLSVDPASVDFGQVPAKTKSAPRVVTVSNGGAPVTLDKLSVGAPFELASDQCSNAILRGGQSCTFSVVFAPTRVGTRTTTLYINAATGVANPVHVSLAGAGTSDATTPGETKLVSVDDDPASDLVNTDPAISNDGRYVAFDSAPPYVPDGGAAARGPELPKLLKDTKGTPAKKAPPAPRSAVVEALTANAIHLRDQSTGTTERLSPVGQVPISGPDVSGNAGLVAYLGATPDASSGDPVERTANVYAVNRQNPAAPVVRAVSGTPTDLPYQRTVTECVGTYFCTPRLSDDGTSIVFSGRQGWYNPSLSLEVEYQGDVPRPWSPVDFTPATGTGPYTQQVTVRARDAVQFSGAPVVDGGEGAFRINGTTCGSSLAAEQTCTVDVEFVAPRCGETFAGALRTQSATPLGQTAVALVGTMPCPIIIRANPEDPDSSDDIRPGANAPGCAPIPAPATGPTPTDGTQSNVGNPQAFLPSLQLDGVAYLGLTITNDSTVSAGVRFETPQCGMAFVTPAQTSTEIATCQDGQSLPAGQSCVAYVGFKPDAIGEVVANVILYLGNPNIKLHRFVGEGYLDSVFMRRDPSGNGNFAGEGKPAPEIVSVDGNGAPMTSEAPVVSGDGRYVAFVSSAAVGRDAGDDSPQVYLRDRTEKTTKLVSRLPGGGLDETGAQSPSLSRDGSRIAYETRRIRDGEPSSPYADVYVHDLPSGRVVLASAASGSSTEGGNGDSTGPSLSDDGTTVAFQSFAGNLVEQPANDDGSVLVREVERDFAGDSPRENELVSLTNAGQVVDGASFGPAVNDDGAFVAFGSQGQLVPEDSDGGAWDVYVRRRLAQLQVEPAALDFGTVKIGQTSAAKRVTVTNTGSGPADIGTVTAAAPFAPGAETCAKLRRGKSCTVDATFAPTAEGSFSGALNLPVSQGYLALPAVGATLAGVGEGEPVPVASYEVSPLFVDFGEVLLGKEASPSSLTVRNTGAVPLAFGLTTASAGGLGDYSADGTACAVVMPGMSCAVPVRFAPRAKGVRTGTVTFGADAQDPAAADPAPVEVSLTGVGTEEPPKEPPPTEPRVAAMKVTPTALAFPAEVLNVPGVVRSVVVQNVGDVPLAVAGEVRAGATEFYSRSTGCLILLPGVRCTIDVRFAPRALGARVGTLKVFAASIDPTVVSPFPVDVSLSGTTKPPTLVLEPTVGRPGQVTMVRGENFPPAQQVALSWQFGLGTAVATPDAAGTFTAPMLVYRRDSLGERVLSAAIPSLTTPTLSAPYLVEPLSSQPPVFFRW